MGKTCAALTINLSPPSCTLFYAYALNKWCHVPGRKYVPTKWCAGAPNNQHLLVLIPSCSHMQESRSFTAGPEPASLDRYIQPMWWQVSICIRVHKLGGLRACSLKKILVLWDHSEAMFGPKCYPPVVSAASEAMQFEAIWNNLTELPEMTPSQEWFSKTLNIKIWCELPKILIWSLFEDCYHCYELRTHLSPNPICVLVLHSNIA